MPPSPSAHVHRSRFGVYLELGKARLSGMVVVTAAVGYLVAARDGIEWTVFLMAVVGTAMAAFSAAGLNQWWEAARDARMERTRSRPLPAGEISSAHALAWSLAMGAAGVVVLALGANLLTAALGLGNILIYVLLYTPMKVRSTANTLIGAVCGAIPPMMGVAAATGRLTIAAWVLGAVLFVWQMPHFLALAWMYRRDYADGGFRMLPVVDPTGRLTACTAILYCLMLLPLGIAATLAGMAGWFFGVGSVLLGAWMLARCVRLLHRRTEAHARRLFLASIVYLPLLLLVMVVDRGPSPTVGPALAPGHHAPPAFAPILEHPPAPAARADDRSSPQAPGT